MLLFRDRIARSGLGTPNLGPIRQMTDGRAAGESGGSRRSHGGTARTSRESIPHGEGEAWG